MHVSARHTRSNGRYNTQPQAHQPNCITPAHIIFALTDSLTQLLSHRFFRSLPLVGERCRCFCCCCCAFFCLFARLLAFSLAPTTCFTLVRVRYFYSVSVKIFLVFILADCNVCATCRDLSAPLTPRTRLLSMVFFSLSVFVSNPSSFLLLAPITSSFHHTRVFLSVGLS